MSLGGPEPCQPVYPLVMDAAYAHGVTRAIVIAAGNESTDVANDSPASCRGAIAVASTTLAGNLAAYSNFGAGITLSAPGGSFASGFGSIIALSNTGPTTPQDDAITHTGGTSLNNFIYVRQGTVTSGPGFIGGNVAFGANKGASSGEPRRRT